MTTKINILIDTPELIHGYRLGVGAIVRKEGTYFAGFRNDVPKKYGWQLPQGGVENEEEPDKAVLRELFEETHIQSVRLVARTPNLLYYDVPEKLMPNFWGGKYKGQGQFWYLFDFIGDVSEINLSHFKHPEFVQWKWAPFEEIKANVIHFKYTLYESLERFFSL